jgi:hypothetical protein
MFFRPQGEPPSRRDIRVNATIGTTSMEQALLEKVTVFQIVKKIPDIYGT